MNAALDAEFSLCVLKSRSAPGISPRALIRVLHDEWGYGASIIAKSDTKTPGDHGDPEIARQEKAFYDALTEGQKTAYKAVRELVYQLYNTGESWEGVDAWDIGKPIDEWKATAFNELSTHPMKAYMLGQMLASEALATPMHRPLLPTDGRAIRFLEQTTFNEVDAAFEDVKKDLRRALIDGMINGENPREVARKLANEMNDYETQWKVVAITETSRAESTGRLQEFADADVTYCIGSSAHDARACDSCIDLIDGKVHRVSDVQGRTNYGRKQAQWLPVVPMHPNCRCAWLPYELGDKSGDDVYDDERKKANYR